ncbi:NADH:ubiquinone reductase (Na(+)-transporting) subunit E [Candidatus Neptunichlamydia sp. REUL1]|uniref:NADH:ubiquinone reductase (Na(+)-transporting) subunit E n=1 Tax=Candidatus Neptunichlamydia sp. REUL1 TaxID=3064277 RepID=UPI00292FE6C2|nr:NADH:ubiquinone reductase (Na(+)-transporting) subunit E [Candidatus Neptunochlamydia sp. REUL1]
MDPYSILNLLGLAIQSIFIQNILLFNFLGMCSYLACSNKIKTANGLGMAVCVVMAISGMLNWLVHTYITGENALSWLGYLGIPTEGVNLGFLEFLIYISVIAALVQVLEIVIDKFAPALYRALGMYLPLITVNCAILGASLFATVRAYPFIPNLVYVAAAGVGWWVAILLIAAIREKLSYSNVPKGLRGIGLTFIMTGLISLAFMGFAGITLDQVTEDDTYPLLVQTEPSE